MSLSACICVASSRRLEVGATFFAGAGFVVATATAAMRFPQAALPLAAVTPIAIAFLCFRCRGVIRYVLRIVITVSDRDAIAVGPDAESGDEESWRLDASTMMWPGFSVVALKRDGDALHGGRSVRLAMFDPELTAIDLRSLRRFLLWSLRGGEQVAPAPAAS